MHDKVGIKNMPTLGKQDDEVTSPGVHLLLHVIMVRP